jgi:hypothetical protein
MNVLDLTFLSIYRVNGQEWPLLPGLLAQNPPKRSARGRDQDRLFVYLTLAGNVNYSSSEYSEIVGQVAETFYSTPGSLTFALKTAVGALNTYLVERNMKSTGKGLYSIGALVLGNLRGNSMYIVQAGPTHVFHHTGEMQHLYDQQLAGKGLGLGQTARMYFSQVTLAVGERLLICGALPQNWDKSINETYGSGSLESTRQRLLALGDGNVSALLVQAADGSGAMNIIRAVKDEPIKSASPVGTVVVSGASKNQATPTPVPADKAPIFDLSSSGPVYVPVTEAKSVEPGQKMVEVSQPPTVEPVESVAALPEPQAAPDNRQGVAQEKPARAPRVLVQPQARQELNQGVRSSARFLAHAIQSGRARSQKFAAWIEKAIPRLLPDSDEDQPQKLNSRSWAIFFAIAVPILFFVTAGIVYYRLGFDAEYKILYGHAQDAAQQALAETSSSALRVEWQTTLDWLDKADPYALTPNPDAQKLRQDAQNALDNLDKIVRLNFVPAFNTPLSRNLQISRMSATDSDIYLLDAVNGSVLRGVFNSHNYDLDGSFKCGPGTYNDGIQVGKLIDIIALPRARTSDVSLLGIDFSGRLLYCIPGDTPHAAILQAPATGWKGITAIAYDDYSLYVLDAPAHAVWVYSGNEKIEFSEPYFFFGEQVPVMLEQAIDMAVNGDDLYLLHKDGHLATCTYSHIDTSPTRCNDPALYIDTRPSHEGGISLSDGVFFQIIFTSPPDPAVALLEPYTQSIYRFSPRALELQNQVRATVGKENLWPKEMPITAMAFSPNKILFVFVNSQVYFAVNVP